MSFVEEARKTAEYDLGRKETLQKVREVIDRKLEYARKHYGVISFELLVDLKKELGLEGDE
jgi:hypothetical protein